MDQRPVLMVSYSPEQPSSLLVNDRARSNWSRDTEERHFREWIPDEGVPCVDTLLRTQCGVLHPNKWSNLTKLATLLFSSLQIACTTANKFFFLIQFSAARVFLILEWCWQRIDMFAPLGLVIFSSALFQLVWRATPPSRHLFKFPRPSKDQLMGCALRRTVMENQNYNEW